MIFARPIQSAGACLAPANFRIFCSSTSSAAGRADKNIGMTLTPRAAQAGPTTPTGPTYPRHEERCIREEGGALPERVVEEAVRLLWCSRLYPLGRIRFVPRWSQRELRVVRLNRAERKRLRYRYGPRPYGPLPAGHAE